MSDPFYEAPDSLAPAGSASRMTGVLVLEGPIPDDAAMKPQRIQLRRSKGWRMPPNTVKVDRTTLFGNPFSIKEYGHDRAVELHRAWLTGELEDPSIPPSRMKTLTGLREKVLAALPSLRGRNLACWCRLPEAGQPDNCHAALLLRLANR